MLGIVIHGTFILGLPGETKETIEETIRFAKEINPHTIQVSLAAPYPGTFLYNQARENNWLHHEDEELSDRSRHADRAALLPASHPYRDLRVGRDVLQAILFPRAEDRRHRRRDGAEPRDDEAEAARGVEFFRFLRERRDLPSDLLNITVASRRLGHCSRLSPPRLARRTHQDRLEQARQRRAW